MKLMEAIAMYTIAVAEIVLLGRLLFLGFHRRYPFFFAFVMADVAQTLAGNLVGMPLNSHGYLWFWALSESALVALQALAAREVCTRIRASYPGIGRLGRGITEWAFIIAVVVCLATLFVDVWRANWHEIAWSAGLILRRAVATVLALTMACVALLIRWAPAPIAPNVRRHARIMAGYLATVALVPFLIAVQLLGPDAGSVVMLSLSAVFFGSWVWAFRRGQDEAPPAPVTMTIEELRAAERDFAGLVDELRKIASRLFH